MAIFIFTLQASIKRARSSVAAMLFAVVSFSCPPARGAGYMISAKDRARASALSQQAYVTFQSGDYTQALGLLTQSDQLKPDQPDGWNLRGVIYLKLKDYEKAQAALARAIALDPDLWAARFNLAEVFFQHKDYARARASFEYLLSQTDRFKEKNKWELVQYKTIVCSVLLGDEQAAQKKLAKLPSNGGATPAFFYAQAALAFHGKNPAQAQKALLAAQAGFPVAINDLFADSLVQAGWAPPPVPMATLAANVPSVPPGARGGDLTIDPQLQADSAGPLPVGDVPVRPIVATLNPASRNVAPTADVKPKNRPAPAVTNNPPANTASATGLDDTALLLD